MPAKYDLTFSLQLLKSNRQHHKKGIKKYTITKKQRENLKHSPWVIKNIDAGKKHHETLLEDLDMAIKILEEKNTRLSN